MDEILDCPACGETYDDADADFLICSKCGHNANKEKPVDKCNCDDCSEEHECPLASEVHNNYEKCSPISTGIRGEMDLASRLGIPVLL